MLFRSAITYFDKTLAINPHNVDALLGKGLALTLQDKPQEAIQWFDKILVIVPNDQNTLSIKKDVLSIIGPIQDSSLDSSPSVNKNSEPLKQKVINSKCIVNSDDTVEQHEEALKVDQKNIKDSYRRGYVLSETGRYQDAITIYEIGRAHV